MCVCIQSVECSAPNNAYAITSLWSLSERPCPFLSDATLETKISCMGIWKLPSTTAIWIATKFLGTENVCGLWLVRQHLAGHSNETLQCLLERMYVAFSHQSSVIMKCQERVCGPLLVLVRILEYTRNGHVWPFLVPGLFGRPLRKYRSVPIPFNLFCTKISRFATWWLRGGIRNPTYSRRRRH